MLSCVDGGDVGCARARMVVVEPVTDSGSTQQSRETREALEP
jgi:hypothetical protein